MSSQNKPENDFFMKSELKQFGFTEGAITKFLGSFDIEKKGRYKNSPTLKLFQKKRVDKVVKSKAFKDWLEQNREKRQKIAAASKARQDKLREELFSYILSLKITSPFTFETYDELVDFSCDHYNALWHSRGEYEKFAQPSDDPVFLDRIIRNCVRHYLEIEPCDYDNTIAALSGKTGKDYAYELLRSRADDVVENYISRLEAR